MRPSILFIYKTVVTIQVPLRFYVDFWIDYCLSKALGIPIELALNLLITLGSIDIFTIFLQSMSIRCLPVCVTLNFFQQGFSISACKSFFASLLKLGLNILFDTINGMVTFISFQTINIYKYTLLFYPGLD